MEAINIEPGARLRLQQMAVAGFHQLLLAKAADVEQEVSAPLVRTVVQFARTAAQTVFARENIRGVHLIKRQIPAIETGGAQTVRVVLMRAET